MGRKFGSRVWTQKATWLITFACLDTSKRNQFFPVQSKQFSGLFMTPQTALKIGSRYPIQRPIINFYYQYKYLPATPRRGKEKTWKWSIAKLSSVWAKKRVGRKKTLLGSLLRSYVLWRLFPQLKLYTGCFKLLTCKRRKKSITYWNCKIIC